ncbi:adhesion G protein-coupled receptor L4-like isoform X2 [Tachysurus fulvidraco]|uniref:adhesion G protein-coupled receptor L4-like isoform X2 n=1 Tax=Tachysurus fulvidraco TaxID=1234273 RepID=UPI001FEE9F57|nr:adhesion G protein-coupled receptor L4-like isoform X2 [Tachysurus fulvidraco]
MPFSTDDNLKLLEICQANTTKECVTKCLDYINFTTNNAEQINEEDMKSYLNITMDLITRVMNAYPHQNYPENFGKSVLDVHKKLVSTVVKKKTEQKIIPFSFQNLKGEVFVRKTQNLYSTIELTNVSVVTDINTLPQDNYGTTAVAFMSYSNVEDILKPSFFNTVTNTAKTTLMSTVVSAVLLAVSNQNLIQPVNFKLTHIATKESEAFLSCMDWETNSWDTCFLTKTTDTWSMCSCKRLIPFALISQIGPCQTVEKYLRTITNLTNHVMNQSKQNSYGNVLMIVTEKLASALEHRPCTDNSTISISLQTLEVQVFMVGACVNFSKIPTLITTNATLDINLTGNLMKEHAAVAFVSYTNMEDILEPSFNTFTDTDKTIMSVVVSATLPKNPNPKLTEPVNFTLKHMKELAPNNILTCMYWDQNTWDGKYCNLTETNSSHSVCSCDHLATVTLVMQTDPCMRFVIGPCAKNFLYQITAYTPEELPQEMVKNYLNIVMNLTTRMTDSVSDQNLASYGYVLLNVTEKLVSTLVRKRNPPINISLSVQDLVVQVFVMTGSDVSLSENPKLGTKNTSINLDLVEISENSNGSAAVAFISYTNMTNQLLNPTLFNKITKTVKTMMSNVVSVSLPKTANRTLTKPINITFKYINEFDPEGILSCVYWNKTMWQEEGYSFIQTNTTHTVCSYSHLSTFALIMQTDPCRSDRVINTLIAVAIIVGLVFLSLSIVTLSLYSRNPVTNAALINLCINLLLFHFLSLIKTLFLANIQSLQLRAVLAGFQWYFLMSVFVWMFLEAMLLYNFMKNLSNITSISEQVFSWKWLIVIGYLIPLGVLGISGVRFPKDYIDDECWLNDDNSFFIFAAPLILTVSLNLVPYGIIIMIFTLKCLKNDILHLSSSDAKNLIICLMLRSLTQFIILVCYLIFLYIPSKNGALYHAFRFLNSQQGTFIFLIHCLFNQEVRQKYRNVMCVLCFSNNPVETSRSVRGQAEDLQDN